MFSMRVMAEGGKKVVPHGQPIRMRQTRVSEQASLKTMPDLHDGTHSPRRASTDTLPCKDRRGMSYVTHTV